MTALTFNVVYEDAGEGWVYAHVPELPEVQTQGEDLDDARAMVKDAIALVLEERRSRGEANPKTGWAPVEAERRLPQRTNSRSASSQAAGS